MRQEYNVQRESSGIIPNSMQNSLERSGIPGFAQSFVLTQDIAKVLLWNGSEAVLFLCSRTRSIKDDVSSMQVLIKYSHFGVLLLQTKIHF
jgi:hypothetical protein